MANKLLWEKNAASKAALHKCSSYSAKDFRLLKPLRIRNFDDVELISANFNDEITVFESTLKIRIERPGTSMFYAIFSSSYPQEDNCLEPNHILRTAVWDAENDRNGLFSAKDLQAYLMSDKGFLIENCFVKKSEISELLRLLSELEKLLFCGIRFSEHQQRKPDAAGIDLELRSDKAPFYNRIFYHQCSIENIQLDQWVADFKKQFDQVDMGKSCLPDDDFHISYRKSPLELIKAFTADN